MIPLLLVLSCFCQFLWGEALSLSPYKDEMFAPKILTQPEQVLRQEKDVVLRYPNHPVIQPASQDDAVEWSHPDVLNIFYHKQNHLYGWDEIVVKKAKDERVDLLSVELEKEVNLIEEIVEIQALQAGLLDGAKFAVVFVHGGGGDKTLGFNDWSFGGNFNRLKNLIVKNQGVYYSPSFASGRSATQQARLLIDRIKSHAGKDTPIVFACGSAGASICNALLMSERESDLVDGLIYLGAAQGPRVSFSSLFIKEQKPIIVSHGTYDSVLRWQKMKAAFDDFKQYQVSYPLQFQLVHGGIHGTPIRMFDWRQGLNFIFSNL